VLFGSANRDETTYEHPDDVDPDRPSLFQHLAFGRGPHYCIGAPLARLEATIALQVLTQRYEHVEVVHEGTPQYAPSWILRGLQRLDVHLVPR
jgi:cytochrome P450